MYTFSPSSSSKYSLCFALRRHRNILELINVPRPYISQLAVLAPSATVIGDVDINDHASIWYNAVVRGDLNKITIGAFTSIQVASEQAEENCPRIPSLQSNSG